MALVSAASSDHSRSWSRAAAALGRRVAVNISVTRSIVTFAGTTGAVELSGKVSATITGITRVVAVSDVPPGVAVFVTIGALTLVVTGTTVLVIFVSVGI